MTTPPPAAGRRATAQDVARLAGVSRTTVSFVLNDRAEDRGITPATVQRVLEAAAALGYVPDRAARMLRSGTSDLVIFATPDYSVLGPLANILIGEMSDGLADVGLHLLTRRTSADAAFASLWRDLSPAAVVGFELTPRDVADLEEAGVHAVDLDISAFDDFAGSAQAEHLISRGHRELAFAAPADQRLAHFARRRLAGVSRVCAQAGSPPPVEITVDLDAADAVAAVRRLTSHPGVTAVCAYNDEHAFAVLAGMAGNGLKAPDDLAVIGCDNIPLSAVAVPPLTTIDSEPRARAGALVRHIAGIVFGAPTPLVARGPGPRVLVRSST